MISLDRDILTDIVGNDTQDKLNHAYAFGGAEMAINTVKITGYSHPSLCIHQYERVKRPD